jgi:uncharacterized membrane protein
MTWIAFAFCGPVLWALSTHLDKYLLERYFKDSNPGALLVFTALAGVLLLPVIWLFDAAVIEIDAVSACLMAGSGILYMGAMLFYLRALQGEEASVVAPFYQASPLFGYVLGYLVLGEALSPRQMLGGGIIIAGTLLVSLRSGSRTTFKARLAGLMLTCAFALALSSLIFKVFALRDEFWTTAFWMFVGEAIFGAGLLAIAPFRRQFLAVLRVSPGAVLAINGANELINLGGGLGNRYALLLAPLSLVQAIGSTTTLFVFAFGLVLSTFLPTVGREDLSARNLVRKGLSAVLVAVGVMLITQ